MPASATLLSSSAILPYDAIKSFDFFDCKEIDEAIDAAEQMLRHVSRSSLLFAYKMGSLSNPSRLKSHFGINLGQLADMLGVSTTTLRRYRAVNELITLQQLEQLVNNKVSINAVLYIAETMEHSPEVARNVFEALCRGELIEVKDLRKAVSQELKGKLLNFNEFPGGVPNQQQQEKLEEFAQEAKQEEVVSGELVEELSEAADDSTPAEKILDADIEDPDEDEFDEEDKATHSDKPQSQKEAEAFYRNVREAILPLRRNLHDISENLMTQLVVSEEHEGVILSAPAVHAQYQVDILDLARDCQSALEALLKAHLWFKRGGFVERKVEFPEGQSPETLFDQGE